MEKEKTFKILTNEEVNKIETKQKEDLLPKEEVKEIIYSDDLYVVKYMQDTYNLEKKFLNSEQPIPFRIPLFQVLKNNNSELLLAIDTIPTFLSYHLHGSTTDNKSGNLFKIQNKFNMVKDGSYKDCELYEKINNKLICGPYINNRDKIINSIFETLDKIILDLNTISLNATYTHKTDYSGTGPLFEDINVNLITDIPSQGLFTELEANICSSKNIIYPLYYKKSITVDPSKNISVPLNVRQNIKVSFLQEEIILAREDKVDVVSREFVYKKYDDNILVNEKIIDKENLYFNPKENLTISILKQLPTKVVEIALILKRLFGERTALRFSNDYSGAAIIANNFSLVVKLNSTVDKHSFFTIDLNISGKYHSITIDSKDFNDTLSNIIKGYVKKESLKRDIEELAEYILICLYINTKNYNFLYTANDLNPELDYDFWYEDEDDTHGDEVVNNLDSEICKAIKFKKWNSDDLVYFMNFNKNNELFVIINKVENRNFLSTEYGRAINEVDENLHGSLVSFRICLDDDTIVFLPIRNKLGVSYTINTDLCNLDDKTLDDLISYIDGDSIFTELIQNYIKLHKELGNDSYFEIQK